MVRFRPHQAGPLAEGKRDGGLIIQCPKRNPKDFPITAIVFRGTDVGQESGRARRSDLSGRSSPASTLTRPQRRRSFDRWPIWGVKKERRDRERDSRDSPNGASQRAKEPSWAACGWASSEGSGGEEPPQSVPLPSSSLASPRRRARCTVMRGCVAVS